MYEAEPEWLPHDIQVFITLLDTILCNQIVDKGVSYGLDDKYVHNMQLI